MAHPSYSGFYGKLPCKGDFLSRGLPREFTAGLDTWFQQGLVSSQQQLGEAWLEHYMVAPIWHAYIPANELGQHPWLMVFIASVDSVGRKFPALIAQTLPQPLQDFQQFSELHERRFAIEDMLLDGLEPDFNFERFCQTLEQLPPIELLCENPASQTFANDTNLAAFEDCEQLQLQGRCLWWSEGSETVEPQLFVSKGLPAAAQFVSFLQGMPSLIEPDGETE